MKNYSCFTYWKINILLPSIFVGIVILAYVAITAQKDTHIFEYFLGPSATLIYLVLGSFLSGSLLPSFCGIKYILDDDSFAILRFDKEKMKIPISDLIGISKIYRMNYFIVSTKSNDLLVGNIRGHELSTLHKVLQKIVLDNTQ